MIRPDAQSLTGRWQQPARALPLPLAPLPREFLFSYVRRLAATNHTTPRLLLSHLGRHHSHPKAGGIATITYDLALNHAALDRLVADFRGLCHERCFWPDSPDFGPTGWAL
jgi:hypothetical protein